VHRLRTLRQHGRRARAAQVSAVATILGLLLVVTFIAQFVIAPLPTQMSAIEYEHTLLVENQLARLQATVLAQASYPGTPIVLTSPVTLGSGAVLPWASPAAATVGAEPGSIRTSATYALSQVVPAPPNWNAGSSCLSGGAGSCTGGGTVDSWNETNANNTAFTITVTGGTNSLRYNISGNNDTINIGWTGGNTGIVTVILNGSDDVVNYNKGGSDTTSSPIANFYFYGQRDTINFSPSGSHSSKSMTLNVTFVGSLTQVCPYGNLSSTDTLGTLGTGGSNLFMNVTWWNAIGWASPPHTVTYPGGGSTNEHLTFQNQTGVVACAFTRGYATTYTYQYSTGLSVHLLNHYQAPTDVAYDQGAVIEHAEGGPAVMVDPPAIDYSPTPQGSAATVTLVNILGNISTTGGTETAGITTQVVSVQTITVANGQGTTYLSTPLFLNVTTLYPQAWATFFGNNPSLFPYGTSCAATGIHSPYTCLDPPPGMSVRLSVGLVAQTLTIRTITVSVTID